MNGVHEVVHGQEVVLLSLVEPGPEVVVQLSDLLTELVPQLLGHLQRQQDVSSDKFALKVNLTLGAAWHRGSIRTSHPAARVRIPALTAEIFYLLFVDSREIEPF